jgi:hypothetical protein
LASSGCIRPLTITYELDELNLNLPQQQDMLTSLAFDGKQDTLGLFDNIDASDNIEENDVARRLDDI